MYSFCTIEQLLSGGRGGSGPGCKCQDFLWTMMCVESDSCPAVALGPTYPRALDHPLFRHTKVKVRQSLLNEILLRSVSGRSYENRD